MENFEDLLKDALIPSKEPDAMLTQEILQKAKGEESMRKPNFRTATVTAAIAAAVIATGGVTAYAAWNYLNPEQVAEEMGDKRLAKSFNEESAIRTNDSQTYGNYIISMLGVVSGKNISDLVEVDDDGNIHGDKTYAVIAIKKKDGSKMPDTSDDEYNDKPFLVSPFIKGEDPLRMNVFYMGGGKSNCVVDGVSYHILECDNLECFAKRGVYVGVLDEQFYNVDAYNFDKKTGEISRNKEFKGVNALFNLPLDEAKADEKAAEEKLAEWRKSADDDESDSETESGEGLDELSVEQVQKEFTLMKDGIKTYPASEYGELLQLKVSYKDVQSDLIVCPKEYFKKGEYGIKVIDIAGDEDDTVIAILCERCKDGKVVLYPYHN